MRVPKQPPGNSLMIGDAALSIPSVPLYGEQTRLAIANFDISGQRIPRALLRALGTIKAAAAVVNRDLGPP